MHRGDLHTAVRYAIEATALASGDEYNIDAIVEEIRAAYPENPDDCPAGIFWPIVERHANA